MLFGSKYVAKVGTTRRFYNRIFGFPLYIGDRVRAHHVVRLLNPNPEDTILDAGCGIGVYSIEYGLKGAQVIGVDISRERIHQAYMALKAVGMSDQAFLVIADICNLPIKRGVFNKISCVDVLEHIKKDFESVAEFRRVLKSWGALVAHVPQASSACSLLSMSNQISYSKNLGHVRMGYTVKELRKLLNGAGFSVTRLEETFKKFAGLAFEINHILKHSLLGSVLFPILYTFSMLDFLSKGKGKGLLITALPSPLERSTDSCH